MNLPPRWALVREFFEVLQAPLLDVAARGVFAVEANGPDGGAWTEIRPTHIALGDADPALASARAVARHCGARRDLPDPPPGRQDRRGVYYSPASLRLPRRRDASVTALAAVVVDVDDKNHGGRDGSLRALGRAPSPTFKLHSGGGLQGGYVLREAVEFDRSDPASLEGSVRSYLRAALALQRITGADPTHWPSHLFRCPGAYHLKEPNRPVLVTVEIDRHRTFNLSDFDDLVGCLRDEEVDEASAGLIASLRGLKRARRKTKPTAIPKGSRVVLPRRVSASMLELLNRGVHPNYTRADGTLDRSRAAYGAAISLLAAGLGEADAIGVLGASALCAAVDDRGNYGDEWLAAQVSKAGSYLAGKRGARGRPMNVRVVPSDLRAAHPAGGAP